ncbi:MAG: AbgT family transporter [Lachnospiraceae bacterium]
MKTKENKKKSLGEGFLSSIETLGNKLPHPISIFAILCLAIMGISAICAFFGVSATGEIIDNQTKELTEKTFFAVSLLTRDGLAYMLTNAVSNFTSFAPLGVVLVTMLGVGCAEGSGYLSAAMKSAVAKTPAAIVTPMIVFLGIMSNVASDVGYVVLIPLGAIVFLAYNRHPLAGLAAAFAGVSGGFSANLFIGTLDPMLSGLSKEAAQLIQPGYDVQPTSNWYFMAVSTFLIVIIGTLVTDKIVEPRLIKSEFQNSDIDSSVEAATNLSKKERKALKIANFSLLATIVVIVCAAIPQNSFLRNAETGSLTQNAPFMSGLIVLIAILFFVPSVVYGRISGKYKGEKDVCAQLGENMASMGGYIALAFVAAQFINYFSYTGLGTILALNGANLISKVGLGGPVLMVLFIIFVGFVNLLMGSASAKWAILAPVFVPMFMLQGYSPELTQVAYRIGDSTTNLITPLMAYFAMIVVFAKKYDPKSGIGTLIATMVPYSIFFMIGWSVLLVIWMLLGLPLGPGAALML